RRREADADLARELRVGAGHERGHLLVPDLDEVDPAVRLLLPREGAHDAVDPVAGVSEDAPHPPLAEPREEEVADGFSHESLRWFSRCLRTRSGMYPSAMAHRRRPIGVDTVVPPCFAAGARIS